MVEIRVIMTNIRALTFGTHTQFYMLPLASFSLGSRSQTTASSGKQSRKVESCIFLRFTINTTF